MPDPAIEVDLVVEDDRWTAVIPDCAAETEQAVRLAFAEAGFSGPASLCVLLSEDTRLRDLNRDYRGKDAPTNVLSFPMESNVVEGVPRSLGDVALAFETVEREAAEGARPLTNHFRHLIVHGSLHLIGYTHESDDTAACMESLEIAVLARLGVPDPYGGPAPDGLVRNGNR